MTPRLTLTLMLSTLVMIHHTVNSEDDKDTKIVAEESVAIEKRGFSEFDAWKPQSSTPDVILIKQKDPDSHHHHGHHDHESSLSSMLKDKLPLLAVLAPLAAVAVLFPLKSFLGPNYVLYPPATPAPPSSTNGNRIGKELDNTIPDTHNMATQILKMISDIEKMQVEDEKKDKGRKKAMK